MPQFDKVSKEYSEMILVDPIKTFAQRPFAIKYLGHVKNKLVLDIGCGDGEIARMIAAKGAKVVAYDISRKQILLAKSKSNNFPQIKYFVSYPKKFKYKKKFDLALTVMVLLYSKNLSEYYSLFYSAFNLLKPGGKLVVLDCDLDKIPFGKKFYGRFFKKAKRGVVKVSFSVPNSKKFWVNTRYLSRSELISIAKSVGFTSVKCKKLIPTKEGVKIMGKKYWAEFKKSNPWIWLICEKPVC